MTVLRWIDKPISDGGVTEWRFDVERESSTVPGIMPPKRVGAKIPTLSFYARKKPKLSNAYTEEQKAAFDQFNRNVEQPFFKSLISEFQNRFPHEKK